MSSQKLQHYVPKYYFRCFSGNENAIGTLLLKDGTCIEHAPIRGQCAKNDFYGSQEIEQIFSKAESGYSNAMKYAQGLGYGDYDDVPVEWWTQFCESITFQRGRTALECERIAVHNEKLSLFAFEHAAIHSFDPELQIQAKERLKNGEIRFHQDRRSAASFGAVMGMALAPAIYDLRVCFLQNHTDYPFVFADTPVVIYNSHCRQIRNRGVLGWQNRGLQVFYPLNPDICVMLFDPATYSGPATQQLRHAVTERKDVSQINALQFHESLHAVYFACQSHAEYVYSLWNCHRHLIKPRMPMGRTNTGMLIDDQPIQGEHIHMMLSQSSHDLDLTFVSTNKISEHDYSWKPRDPHAKEVLDARMK